MTVSEPVVLGKGQVKETILGELVGDLDSELVSDRCAKAETLCDGETDIAALVLGIGEIVYVPEADALIVTKILAEIVAPDDTETVRVTEEEVI